MMQSKKTLNKTFTFFSLLVLFDAFIGMIGLWFQCHSHTPMTPVLRKSGSSSNVVNISRAMSKRHCFCSKFSNFGTIFAITRFLPKTSVKIAWHQLNDRPTSSATCLIVMRRLSKIIFFTALIFSLLTCSVNQVPKSWTYQMRDCRSNHVWNKRNTIKYSAKILSKSCRLYCKYRHSCIKSRHTQIGWCDKLSRYPD